MFRIILAIASLGVFAGAAAGGDPSRNGAGARPIDKDVVHARLAALGYGDYALGIADGRLQARVMKDGARIAITLDPISGKVIKIRRS